MPLIFQYLIYGSEFVMILIIMFTVTENMIKNQNHIKVIFARRKAASPNGSDKISISNSFQEIPHPRGKVWRNKSFVNFLRKNSIVLYHHRHCAHFATSICFSKFYPQEFLGFKKYEGCEFS